MSNQQADKRTAAQRIDDMERGLMALYQTADNMARDLMTIKEAIKLLGNKLDAVVKASNRGEQLNDEVISKIMVENNIEELKSKVQDLVNQGVLQAAEEVTPNSFVVGREIDENGTVQNPRMQFVVSALAPNVKDKFPGAKAGQTLELEEGKWKFEIQEVYSLVVPSAPAPQAQEQQAEASTDEAPQA
jgi:hypothetical protein